ncbi:MAG TPA: AAA family ATPase [Gemmatimonadaceae bacterium]|nr:AAA family ATPase [Gemmatimonadaceae bacterium]
MSLRSISLRRRGSMPAGFPFDVPVVRSLETLELAAGVTFFVGENGSGKSTLLEAIALAAELPTVGSEEMRDDATLGAQRALAKHLAMSWTTRSKRGFFLRAEDFFGYAKRLSRMKAEMRERIAEIEREYEGRSEYARGLAMGPAYASLDAIEGQYGGDLDGRSHGQSFLTLFQARFVPGGLHLLDEPEAPLSPQSQLALMALMQDMIAEGGQFVVATHSPLLLAFPDATIYTFDRTPPERVEFEDLEHVNLTRAFLNDPKSFLRRLT